MAAQIYFLGRGKPADVIAARSIRPEKGGFRELVFLGNGLAKRRGQGRFQGTDGSRIAPKELVGKSVNVVQGNGRHWNGVLDVGGLVKGVVRI